MAVSSLWYSVAMPPPSSSAPQSTPGTPAGSGNYLVRQGDCIASIAAAHGFFWKTIWEHADNASLRQARGNGHILLPGDRLAIPALSPKEESCAAAQHHRFRRLGVPSKLRIRVVRYEPPDEHAAPETSAQNNGSEVTIREPAAPSRWSPRAVANTRWNLTIDGNLTSGSTDADGNLEASIPPGAASGRLVINPGHPTEFAIEFDLGVLDPDDSPTGLTQRLRNLGFGAADAADPASLAEALEGFQHVKGLGKTGQADDSTINALKEAHGA